MDKSNVLRSKKVSEGVRSFNQNVRRNTSPNIQDGDFGESPEEYLHTADDIDVMISNTLCRDLLSFLNDIGERAVRVVPGKSTEYLNRGDLQKAMYLISSIRSAQDKDRWLSNEPYVFNEKTDTYVTFLKAAGGAVTVKGDTHRAMLRRYSDHDGNPASINEISRDFGFPRSWFIEYKRAHGWAHDQPVTQDQEHIDKPEPSEPFETRVTPDPEPDQESGPPQKTPDELTQAYEEAKTESQDEQQDDDTVPNQQ